MAAGLHGSLYQEELIRLLLMRGADPSIRNLENDQPVHLLQSGEQGEKVSTACSCDYDSNKLSETFENGYNVSLQFSFKLPSILYVYIYIFYMYTYIYSIHVYIYIVYKCH